MYIRNILGTIASKSLIMILSFGLVVISTNLWGAEGRGNISIMIANISLIAIFNNLLGGSSITYFTPKYGASSLILPAYIWTTIGSFLGSLIIYKLQDKTEFWYLFVLSLFLSFQSIHLKILLAKENFKSFNVISLLLPLLNLFLILIFFYAFHIRSFTAYYDAYLIALIVLWILSVLTSKKYYRDFFIYSPDIIKKSLKYGWQVELSNFLQFINYRLSYFLILYFLDVKSVGLYSVGIALAEAIWLIVRSISLVQYSKIANNIDKDKGIKLTIDSAKVSLYFSLFTALSLLIIPSSLYTFVFGKEFTHIKPLLLMLLPGIIALSFSNVHGHYFSATGQTKPLILKSLIGLIPIIVLGPIFIYYFGLNGASIITSISYISSTIFLLVIFYREIRFKSSDVLMNIKELTRILREQK